MNERGGGDPKNIVRGRLRLGRVARRQEPERHRARARSAADRRGCRGSGDVDRRAGGCQGIFHAISEEDLERILRHPATMIGSDGEIPTFGKASPASAQLRRFPGQHEVGKGRIPVAIHVVDGRAPADEAGGGTLERPVHRVRGGQPVGVRAANPAACSASCASISARVMGGALYGRSGSSGGPVSRVRAEFRERPHFNRADSFARFNPDGVYVNRARMSPRIDSRSLGFPVSLKSDWRCRWTNVPDAARRVRNLTNVGCASHRCIFL